MITKRRSPASNLKLQTNGAPFSAKAITTAANLATNKRELFLMKLMQFGQRTLFFNTQLRVFIYLGCLFIISLIADFKPFPKNYFACRENIFNLFIMKWGWGWTLLLTVPFSVMTTCTMCSPSDRRNFLRHLGLRIVVGNVSYFSWTRLFDWIEAMTATCSAPSFHTKPSCLTAGHLWNAFDISGHAFLLIYCSLMLIEEAKPIIKWELINEYLSHQVQTDIISQGIQNPLSNLNAEQLKNVRGLYKRLTPFIRILFIGICALQLLWDAMLIGTILYYHNMIEKLISGIVAAITWYFTYHFWYRYPNVVPHTTGIGNVKHYDKNNNTRPGDVIIRQKSKFLVLSPLYRRSKAFSLYWSRCYSK